MTLMIKVKMMGKKLPLEELEKHQEITSATFDHEGAHLAVTHQIQGGASSGWNTSLLMKGEKTDVELIKALEQVTITMSFEEFLKKFFDIWSCEDREMLAMIAGFETEREYRDRLEEEGEMDPYEWDYETETYEEYRQRKMDMMMDAIEIMKSANEDQAGDLSTDQKIGLLHFQKSFEDYLGRQEDSSSSAISGEENIEKASQSNKEEAAHTIDSGMGDTPEDTNIDKGNDMSKKVEDKALEKSEAELALEARIAELEKDAKDKETKLEKASEELTVLEKQAARIEELEKAEEGRIEKGYQAFANDVSYFEGKEELVKALMDIRHMEAAAVIVDCIEKGQEALVAATSDEVGITGEVLEKSKDSKMDDYITSKYSDKTYL